VGTRLDNVADSGHVVSMTTNARATDMTNAETLMDATTRLDEAERGVRIAAIRLSTLVRGAPLRFRVEATRRLRDADTELEAARVAYDAAQDLPAPEG
jgi:hypothetical protein